MHVSLRTIAKCAPPDLHHMGQTFLLSRTHNRFQSGYVYSKPANPFPVTIESPFTSTGDLQASHARLRALALVGQILSKKLGIAQFGVKIHYI